MVNVGHNFGQKNQCKICSVGNDDQEHLLQCFMLKISNSDLLQNLNYSDIFNDDSEWNSINNSISMIESQVHYKVNTVAFRCC